MPYTVENARPELERLLANVGVTEITMLDDEEISKVACKRILTAKYKEKKIAVICFPLVLRTEAAGKSVQPQRYIDINSSAWDEIIKYWKKACIQDIKCLLLGIRHEDKDICEHIFSVEGDLSLFSGRSVYIHAEHLRDIRNDLDINVYDIPDEQSGKLAIFKKDMLEKYIDSFENHFSSKSVIEIIRDYVITLEEENLSVVEKTTTEGKKLFYYTTKYERKASNRDAAIKIHGTNCFGCGFNFEEHYGERGKGYIEIHHVKPLYELDEEVNIDVEKDLIPLCSNCHRMVHKVKKDVLTLEELRKILNENKDK